MRVADANYTLIASLYNSKTAQAVADGDKVVLYPVGVKESRVVTDDTVIPYAEYAGPMVVDAKDWKDTVDRLQKSEGGDIIMYTRSPFGGRIERLVITPNTQIYLTNTAKK